MESIITTLPITPSKSSPYLRFYTPLVADIISRLTGIPFVLFCNTVGMKTSYSADEQQRLFEMYKAQLSSFGIQFVSPDHDGSSEYRNYFSDTLGLLKDMNILNQTALELAWCRCGKVEIPKVLLKDIFSRSHGHRGLVSNNETNPICAVCGGSLNYSTELVEVIQIPDDNFEHDFVPIKYRSQAKEDYRLITNNPIVVSRNFRADHFDTEFRWLPFLRYITKGGVREVILVVSPNSLFKAIKVLSFTTFIAPEISCKLVVHPLLRVIDGKTTFKGLGLQGFIESCGGIAEARGFMALGTQWSSSESKITSDELHSVKLCVNHFKKSGNNGHLTSLGKIIEQFDREHLKFLFKEIRSYRDVKSFDNWLLSQVFAMQV